MTLQIRLCKYLSFILLLSLGSAKAACASRDTTNTINYSLLNGLDDLPVNSTWDYVATDYNGVVLPVIGVPDILWHKQSLLMALGFKEDGQLGPFKTGSIPLQMNLLSSPMLSGQGTTHWLFAGDAAQSQFHLFDRFKKNRGYFKLSVLKSYYNDVLKKDEQLAGYPEIAFINGKVLFRINNRHQLNGYYVQGSENSSTPEIDPDYPIMKSKNKYRLANLSWQYNGEKHRQSMSVMFYTNTVHSDLFGAVEDTIFRYSGGIRTLAVKEDYVYKLSKAHEFQRGITLNHYLHSLYYFSDNDNYTFGRADLFRSAYYRQLSNYVTAFAGFNNRWSSFLKSRAGLRYNHFSQHKGGGLTYYLQVKCRLHEKLLFYCMTNTELRPINVVNIFNREQALYVDADNVSELWAPRMEQFQVGFKFSFNKHNILNFQYYKREYRVLARSSRYYPFGMKMEPDDPYEAASFRFGTVRGAEVRLSSHFVKWFQMNLHYQYNDGEYSDYSDMSGYNSLPAKYAHKHLGTLEGNMMLGPLRINVMYRYGSGLYYRDLSKSIIRSDGSLALLDHDSEYRSLPAYQRLDAHVEMNFILCGHALKLYGHGVNLLQNKNIKDYAWRTESGSWYSTETSIEKYTFTMMPRSYNIGIAIAK